MSTPSAPEPPDARDPRTAEWLAVEPLDELTRARLVRSALAESDAAPGPDASPGRNRTARFLAVAAALLVVLVAGIAVLVPRSSNDSTPTAADVPAAKRATPEAAEAPATDSSRSSGASGATAQADAAPTALSPLGDLGDVSTRALLRAAAGARRDPPFADRTVVPPTCAVQAGRSLGTPIAAGTGTVNGKPATVILVQRPDGLSGAVAVVDRSCALGPSVLFP